MALDTFANLKTAIATFLNRSDMTAVIPDFITLAEAQIVRRLTKAWQQGKRPRRMVSRDAAFSIATETVAAPTGFLGPVSLSIDAEAVQLSYLSPENFTREKARRGTSPTSDTPLVYTVIGSNFQLLPAPDETYIGTLVYWARPAALSDGDPTNWILQYHPDVYLYGALTQSAPYLQHDERLTVWGTLFTTALDDLINSDPMPTDATPLRVDSGLLGYGGYAYDINAG